MLGRSDDVVRQCDRGEKCPMNDCTTWWQLAFVSSIVVTVVSCIPCLMYPNSGEALSIFYAILYQGPARNDVIFRRASCKFDPPRELTVNGRGSPPCAKKARPISQAKENPPEVLSRALNCKAKVWHIMPSRWEPP
ncbi:hypothetical protein KCU81_g50, partial [Aureobasidium melanogenum]